MSFASICLRPLGHRLYKLETILIASASRCGNTSVISGRSIGHSCSGRGSICRSISVNLGRSFIGIQPLVRRFGSCTMPSRSINKMINGSRRFSSKNDKNPSQEMDSEQNSKKLYYMLSVVVFMFGLTYASVPLYKLFCQVTGFGGTTQRVTEADAVNVEPVDGANIITIDFDANVPSTMPWKFYPTQKRIKVVPGETALAFYTAKNPTDNVITGIATYNVHPPKAGLYFNKIQCFCFEEQRLSAKEEVDMPVFFYIDPDFINDPAMKNCTQITLSYTFFDTGKLHEKEKKALTGSSKQ